MRISGAISGRPMYFGSTLLQINRLFLPELSYPSRI